MFCSVMGSDFMFRTNRIEVFIHMTYVQPLAQNIANRGELQGSGIYQSSYILYQKGKKD